MALVRVQAHECGKAMFEYILLCGLLALGLTLGLQTFSGSGRTAIKATACRLMGLVRLGSPGCGAASPGAEAGDLAFSDTGTSEIVQVEAPADELVAGLEGDRTNSRHGLDQIIAAERSARLRERLGPGFAIGDVDIRALVGEIPSAFKPPKLGEGIHVAQGLSMGQSGVLVEPEVRPPASSNGGVRRGIPANLNRPPPRIGGLGPLGLVGALATGLPWLKDLVDRGIPPQRYVRFDERNMLVMDWQVGGAALLGLMNDGELSELRGLTFLRPGALLEATTRDGMVFAERPLTGTEWTLYLSALPEGLAERIRHAPALVWDQRQYRDLPAPMVPLAPGEQLVEFNGIVYVRNLNTGTLRPLTALDGSQAFVSDGTETMSVHGPATSTLTRTDPDVREEDDLDEPGHRSADPWEWVVQATNFPDPDRLPAIMERAAETFREIDGRSGEFLGFGDMRIELRDPDHTGYAKLGDYYYGTFRELRGNGLGRDGKVRHHPLQQRHLIQLLEPLNWNLQKVRDQALAIRIAPHEEDVMEAVLTEHLLAINDGGPVTVRESFGPLYRSFMAIDMSPEEALEATQVLFLALESWGVDPLATFTPRVHLAPSNGGHN